MGSDIIAIALTVILGYLIGSVNISIILTKLMGKQDIRELGSGNAGTTNMTRNYGKTLGVLTMVGDILKGAFAVALGLILFTLIAGGGNNVLAKYLGGFAAVTGHVFPVFFGFRGGKGIATIGGAVIALNYKVAILLFLVMIILTLVTRYVSLSSIISASLITPSFLVYELIWGTAKTAENFLTVGILCFAMSALVIFMHRENMVRLHNKTERRIGDSKEALKEKTKIV